VETASDIRQVAELKGVPVVLLGAHGAPSGDDPFGGTVRAVLDTSGSAVAVLLDRGLGTIRRVACLDVRDADGPLVRALAGRLAAGGATVIPVSSVAGVPSDADLLLTGLSAVVPGIGPSILAVRAAKSA
jgi:hypothetical protein